MVRLPALHPILVLGQSLLEDHSLGIVHLPAVRLEHIGRDVERRSALEDAVPAALGGKPGPRYDGQRVHRDSRDIQRPLLHGSHDAIEPRDRRLIELHGSHPAQELGHVDVRVFAEDLDDKLGNRVERIGKGKPPHLGERAVAEGDRDRQEEGQGCRHVEW